MTQTKKTTFEFHISRQSRDYYQFDQSLFSLSGSVIFANFHAARAFAQKMNQRRDLVSYPETAVRAGQINALGLIDEIMHLVVEEYRQQRNPGVMSDAVAWLEGRVGSEQLDALLLQFVDEFPPLSVYRRQVSVDQYLSGESITAGGETISNRQIALEELLMLWLTNVNPAASPYHELFDDAALEVDTAYLGVMEGLHDFFDTQPLFGPDHQNLIDMLRAPALAHPHSLSGQLDYIRSRWGALLGSFLYRLLSSLDLIKEEEKAIFGVGGGGPSRVYEFGDLELEPERFSQDKDWMPNLVLIAKNSYVWLDQLSKKYQRPITRLDHVPDEELEALARWGFSGLWLIGLWERSKASRTIKQMRGNPEAVASAYSLFSYDIAADLGGDGAFQDLRQRAWQRGVRLASDMVPNHMGIDSHWVIEHPDWFISLDNSPFPSYSFNGPDLSWDERVGIYIEDHYFDNSDAAVVFKRLDHWSGQEKYIYHGNDGTSMPWNDTAQLNYLIPEVREAVIQTILHVARQFPIVRFDAAMTLAKKHYQRLWFPEPGEGGDIPSRAEHGLTRARFDEVFPTEFWREVVDRVAQEVPDTLLLAEAFWLMEGYFVRTLGMHRVYNSAFMNMLRDEKNQEYRLVIKNTLEFDPQILKRYVNFMNNPDERTAVDQFGKGDKYIGVCTLMATLPGLPMFGHGQIEGFTEKYGMEYRKAYWDETPDGTLVERHEREIFPLLRQRWLFAGVSDFLLYDFYTEGGGVNEDVFAYSNRAGDQSSLVVFHNKYAETNGWIRSSAAYLDKSGPERRLVQKDLALGLGLSDAGDHFIIFRDQASSLEYIRSCRELHEKGLFIELRAYQTNVFLDFRQVVDDGLGQYAQLAEYLDGRGVPSIDEAIKELYLQPVHRAFRQLVNPGMFRWLIDNRQTGEIEPETFTQSLDEYQAKARDLLVAVRAFTGGETAAGAQADLDHLAARMRQEMEAALRLPALYLETISSESDTLNRAIDYLEAGPPPAASGEETIETPDSQASNLEDAPARLNADDSPPDAPLAAGDLPDRGSRGFSHRDPTASPPEPPLAAGDPAIWGALLGCLAVKDLGRASAEDRTNASQAAGELSRAWIDEWLLGTIIAGTLVELGAREDAAWRGVHLVRLLTTHCAWCSAGGDAAPTPHAAFRSWLEDSQLGAFLGVNRYQDILWFNQESFETWLWWMYLASVVGTNAAEMDPRSQQAAIVGCFKLVRHLQGAAESSGYQVENLLEAAK
jgi:glycosidase